MKKIILFNIADLIEPYAHPSLGLGYIKSYTLKKHKNNVILKIIRENIYKTLLKENPDLIGISSVTQFYTKAIEFAKEIKRLLKNTIIIIGGIHISTLPASIDAIFDCGVIREGEITFSEIVDLLLNDKFNKNSLQRIKGVAFIDEKKLIVTESRELIQNLDEIPHIDRNDYSHKNFAHIITSRGCPYACAFCASTHFWGTRLVRFHSAKYIYEEIKTLTKRSIKHISIWDDLFAFNTKRLLELLGLLKKDKDIYKRVTFGCTARANIINDDLCEILKKLNVRFVSLGFESGSERILKKIKGAMTLRDNINAMHTLHKWGFIVKGSFVINNPDEKEDDLKLTYKLIKENPLDGGDVNIAIPFPATPYWSYALGNNLVSEKMNFNLLNIKNNIKILKKDDFIKLSEDIDHDTILKWGNLIQQELHKKEFLSFIKLVNLNNVIIALKNPKLAFKYLYGHALDFFKRTKK